MTKYIIILSFESGKYNSILENFIILIIDISNATIQNFHFSNSNHGWLQLSYLISEWICWKFYDIGGPSDFSKGVCKPKLWSKKICTEWVYFFTDILTFSIFVKKLLEKNQIIYLFASQIRKLSMNYQFHEIMKSCVLKYIKRKTKDNLQIIIFFLDLVFKAWKWYVNIIYI